MKDNIRALGYLALIFIMLRTFKSLRSIFYCNLLAKYLRRTIDLASYGRWAVITGSTDGIGKGYAKALATRGMNVFLISRNQDKLDNTAREIRLLRTDIEVRTLAFDFSASDIKQYDVIKEALNGLEIGVLINNVGATSEYPDYFHSYFGGEKFWKSMIDINCTSVMEMTYIVLPQMIKRRKGVVINLSSLFGFIPMPLEAMYSATKTFVKVFTHALIGEYANKGLIFQAVHPLFVATKMMQLQGKGNLLVPDPDRYARLALNTVGLESETNGCFSHALQHALMQFVPNCVLTFIIKRVCMLMRRSALQKNLKNG